MASAAQLACYSEWLRIEVALRLVLLLVAFLSFTLPVHAATFMVSSLADSGPGSLRQAILDANAAPGSDEVIFQAGLTGTIIRSSSFSISDSITISGPGAGALTVSGTEKRIFDVDGGLGKIAVSIRGLTLTEGRLPILDFSPGGAIAVRNANLTLIECVVSNSEAAFEGGGLYLAGGTHLIRNSTISGNGVVIPGFTSGGGIVVSGGDLTIDSSTISGNFALGDFHDFGNGGGLAAYSSSVRVVNSTFSGNFAHGDGAAIYLVGSTLDLSLSTVNGNSFSAFGRARLGSLAVDENGTINITNSIVANTGGEQAVDLHRLSGTINATFSLIKTPGDAINGTNSHNLFGQDPALGPLQNNGGATATHALLPGSPAVAAGDPAIVALPPFDQRGPGFPRLLGNRVDLGSFEAPAQPITAVPTLSPLGILLLGTTLVAAALRRLRC